MNMEMVNGLAFYSARVDSRPPLVLGHALGADHRIWNDVLETIDGRVSVILWDLPGHGRSELFPDPYTIDHLGEILVDALSKQNIDRFHAGGISLGGMAALQLGARFPRSVLSTNIFNATAQLRPEEVWVQRAAQVRQDGMAGLVEPTMQRWFGSATRGEKEEASYLRTKTTFEACDPEGYARCCEMIASTNLWPELGMMGMPTLLVTGQYDESVTPKEVALLASAIPGSMGNASVISGADHMTCIQRPETVAELLVKHVRAAEL